MKKKSGAKEFSPGDEIILRGEVTRVPDANNSGLTFVTVRVDGYAIPITISAERIQRAG
jgi:hypothetical protein